MHIYIYIENISIKVNIIYIIYVGAWLYERIVI